jgi:hypothetical protein
MSIAIAVPCVLVADLWHELAPAQMSGTASMEQPDECAITTAEGGFFRRSGFLPLLD